MSESTGALPDVTERLAAEMREAIAAEQTSRAEHERIVEASRKREQRLAKALSVLETGSAITTPKPAKPAPKAEKKGWNISEERVASIWEATQRVAADAEDGTFTGQTVYQAMYPGVSRETITRAFTVLRERELIRKVGNYKGGSRWALMPGAVEARADAA
jgi:CRP-like cAMP-binding protein